MKRTVLALLGLLSLASGARAADSTVSALTAASTLSGPELFYCVQGGADRKCTTTQVGTFAWTSPTFTGTVTIPTPFTLGAVSVTSTGTQLNYLSAATGTTGTTSTNLVYSTSPTLVTPVLGAATATTMAIGAGSAITSSGAGGALGTNAFTSTAYAPLASPTFTGTVTIPTPFTLGAVSVTSTGTQLNYLSAATGTTGTTSTNVVFSTSPTLVTPALGVATATSITTSTVNGASGLNLQAAGTTLLTLSTSNIINVNFGVLQLNNAILTNTAAATVQHGATDAASPVAQIVQVQRVVAGTSNTAGALWTFKDSAGTGTGISGGYSFQVAPAGSTGTSQNTFSAALTIAGGTGLVALPLITTDATHTDSSVCQDSTSHALYFGSGTLGICLGTSGRQFKTDFAPMTVGLAEIMSLPLQSYRYLPGFGDNGARRQFGIVAQDVEQVLPQLVGKNEQGETINYDVGALWFIALRAIQELKADNDNLRHEIQTRSFAR